MIKVKILSSEFFDCLSNIIFKENQLERYQKLYLHTWFSKVDFTNPMDILKMKNSLIEYFITGEYNSYIVETVNKSIKMFDWFGKPLIGNKVVIDLLSSIEKYLDIPKEYTENSFVNETEKYFSKMNPAEKLSEIIGVKYKFEELKFIIVNNLSNPYNLYPNTIVHKYENNKIWYIAGIGHEFGHILTWDINNKFREMGLLENSITRGFPEIIAHVCTKLLIKSYGYELSDLSKDIKSWDTFGCNPKHVSYKLYYEFMNSFDIEKGNEFEESCIKILSKYQGE